MLGYRSLWLCWVRTENRGRSHVLLLTWPLWLPSLLTPAGAAPCYNTFTFCTLARQTITLTAWPWVDQRASNMVWREAGPQTHAHTHTLGRQLFNLASFPLLFRWIGITKYLNPELVFCLRLYLSQGGQVVGPVCFVAASLEMCYRISVWLLRLLDGENTGWGTSDSFQRGSRTLKSLSHQNCEMYRSGAPDPSDVMQRRRFKTV